MTKTNLVGLVLGMGTVMAIVVALNATVSATWETIDTRTVYGGAPCWRISGVNQCPAAGTTTCDDRPCDPPEQGEDWLCPWVSPPTWIPYHTGHRRLEIRLREFYYPGVWDAEAHGRRNFSSNTVHCTVRITCAATSCVWDPARMGWFCSEASRSNINPRTHYTTTGQSC